MSRLASQWENQLQEHSGRPAFWAEDVKAALGDAMTSAAEPVL
jgi:hypothetical protein